MALLTVLCMLLSAPGVHAQVKGANKRPGTSKPAATVKPGGKQVKPNKNSGKRKGGNKQMKDDEEEVEPTIVEAEPEPEPLPQAWHPSINYSVPLDRDIEVTGKKASVTFVMKGVSGGTYDMGSTFEQQVESNTGMPVHRVGISSFLMSETEVTQDQWRVVMGDKPQKKGGDLPVVKVSYSQCLEFINRLNELTGERFRLPTEAEWEYAARGGMLSDKTMFSGSQYIDEVGWTGQSCKELQPVKKLKPNELGLYDMNGNVWEFTSDWFSTDWRVYPNEEANPHGASMANANQERVIRGGAFNCEARQCKISSRAGLSVDVKNNQSVGLRLVLDVEPEFSPRNLKDND